MNIQQWEPVVLTKSSFTKSVQRHGEPKNATDEDFNVVKKQVEPESLQELCKRRSELKLTQKEADTKCAFPTNTFRNIENKTSVPTEKQHNIIQKVIGIQLKIKNFKSFIPLAIFLNLLYLWQFNMSTGNPQLY